MLGNILLILTRAIADAKGGFTMKEEYKNAEVEIIPFDAQYDVLTRSPNETEEVPIGGTSPNP